MHFQFTIRSLKYKEKCCCLMNIIEAIRTKCFELLIHELWIGCPLPLCWQTAKCLVMIGLQPAFFATRLEPTMFRCKVWCNALLYQLSYMTSSILPLEEIFSDTTTPRVSGQWHWAPYYVNIWKNCIDRWLELVGYVEFSCTVVICEHWVSQKAATTFCQLPYMAYMRGHYFWRNHGYFNQCIGIVMKGTVVIS